jgi:ribosomal protein S18 acetylase RimI-like enzyme
MMPEAPSGYRLVEGPPAVDAYLSLREKAGMSPKTRVQAETALPGSWASCHVVAEATDQTVGMARVIGDGGAYFQIIDMAVAPEHQRQGLGHSMLSFLLARIHAEAPPQAYVSLLADPPGRKLYEHNGFADVTPLSRGMARRVP